MLLWCYILNNNGGYPTIMFNNYLHINFSSTLVGVTLLCSQLTFWIITPSMMKTLPAHLNRIKIISHLSFPYCLEVLLKQRWEETGHSNDTGQGWRSTFSDKGNWAWLQWCSTALRACSRCQANPSTPPAQKPHRQATRIFVQARLSSIMDVSGWAGEVPRHQQPFISPCRTAPIWPQQQ